MMPMTPRRTSLLAACDSSKLFDFKAWPRQRELLAAVDAGPRIHVWALGRRSGKTTLAALVCLHACLLRPDLDEFMRTGERRYAVAVATNLRQARLLIHAALSIVERSPLLAGFIEAATEDEIRFTNGTALAAFPCSSRGGRGWPICALVMDEAAHFLTDTEGPQVAERVWNALVPSTAQFGVGARLILSSTPYGRDGLFAETWHRADSGELPDARAIQLPTAAVNPTVDQEVLERERVRDPDSFEAEYEAKFLGAGAAYLDMARVEETIADRGPLAPDAADGWVAGLDPAFTSDPFGLVLLGRDRHHHERLVLGIARSWAPRKGESFEERRLTEDEILAEVGAVCRQYNAAVVTDQYAASAVTDRLGRMGLHVTTVPMTGPSKTAAFGELRAKLYTGELELYSHPDLLDELRRLRTKFTPGGASVINPRVGGSHGDIAQALALAVYHADDHRYKPAGALMRPPGGGLANSYSDSKYG